MEKIDWENPQLHKAGQLAERILFPLILLLYPLIRINQGIDVTDSTYSAGNFVFFHQMEGMWALATYLANVVGSFFTRLPYGDTLLGLNFYTGLVLALTALVCYEVLKKEFSPGLTFLGEIIAISLCWCPTTVLYNYLTYFFFTLAALLLLQAFRTEKKKFYVLAGVCLGLNVMVRFPNVLECGLILGVWYYAFLRRKKAVEALRETGLCIAGFFGGFGAVLLVICLRYGFGDYLAMIGSLFGMTQTASDYTPAGMLSDTLRAYLTSGKWFLLFVLCTLAATAMFCYKKRQWLTAKKALFGMGVLLLLRFCWGRGMYTFRYYDYEAMFQWGMLFLLLAVICCLIGISGRWADPKEPPERTDALRALSLMLMLLILITPLGSNNYTFPNLNNLFLLAPYTLWMCVRLWKRAGAGAAHFPWKAMTAALVLMVTVQGIGFFTHFSFRDGILGNERDSRVPNNPRLIGMDTTAYNAAELSRLTAFISENNLEGTPMIFYADAPGLSYILNSPPAIFTSWPELDSNLCEQLEESLSQLTQQPPVIIRNPLFGMDTAPGPKLDLILDYMTAHHYDKVYQSATYRVYLPPA